MLIGARKNSSKIKKINPKRIIASIFCLEKSLFLYEIYSL
ncbi:hypothetical protein HMPREF9088_1408 [Enterococcus italicus DSM 15952]|uniref:Uncharacterized protein n=1 Tax=Enterococcus italicus (strain DSM 15952 / CCUG 50447 / LMG 22039 / TP 1.5) TaxID=888064 RepID=E6LGB8_ENTI1|nr:hypothetical protein HMPREF9088_1408 [Enterococcus italicus DSM 15952]